MQKNTTYIIGVILIVLVGAGGFYGGMVYGKSKSGNNAQVAGQRQNGVPGQFANRTGTGAANGTARRAANGAGFVNGQVIAKDSNSITVKSQDGSSKIIFLSDQTQITKSASGTLTDLVNNGNVMVNGTTNADGSITATFIQIRPQGQTGGPQGQAPQGQAPGQVQPQK